jgi:starch phosphorylase
VPSLSILDGWWIEGNVEGRTGWAIGALDGHADDDARALIEKLAIVAALYAHEPRAFDEVRRYAIAINGSYFTTERMAREYAVNAYRNAAFPAPVDEEAVA